MNELIKKLDSLFSTSPTNLNDAGELFGEIDKVRSDIVTHICSHTTISQNGWLVQIQFVPRQREKMSWSDFGATIPGCHNHWVASLEFDGYSMGKIKENDINILLGMVKETIKDIPFFE